MLNHKEIFIIEGRLFIGLGVDIVYELSDFVSKTLISIGFWCVCNRICSAPDECGGTASYHMKQICSAM